ncbi:MAG: metallophosphoesterase [Clostridia bacterium]|nr:metallophosphoesterase [Clostridia bacterium]
MKKRLTAFLLLVIMGVTFIACGETKTPEKTEAVNSSATESAATESSKTESSSSESSATESSATDTSAQTESSATETAAQTETGTATETETETTGGQPEPPPAEEKSAVFDENNIVFTFAAISDTHINDREGAVADKFVSALQQLKARAEADSEGGLNAVMIAGDLIDTGYSDRNYKEIPYFRDLYESVLDPAEVPMIYCLGNHDVYGWWTARTIKEGKNFEEKLGEAYFTTDTDLESLEALGCRHCVINGYHVLTMNPVSDTPVTYEKGAKDWLDETLAKLTAEEPEKYVIVLTHPMIYDTVYGSTLGEYWDTHELTPILEKYPQVITFSGHLHFPTNDPRSIMQDAFTSVGCASVRYMAIESGNYMYMAGSTTMLDKDLYSQGLLVEVDGNGNMRLIRMDFYHEDVIGEYWEISYPNGEKTHLEKYTIARGSEENNTAPTLSTLEYSFTKKESGNIPLTVTFAAAEDDEFAHDYILTVTSEKGVVTRLNILADFFMHPSVSDMKKTWTVNAGSFAAGSYTITLIAKDSWKAESEPLTVTAKLENMKPDEESGRENAPLSLYADLDFSDGAATDALGNVDVRIKGATVEKTKVKIGDAEYETDAFRATKGQYAVCTFNKITTPEEMREFAEGGFTVEAFYFEKRNSQTQGVVCGTQNGGWGLAINSGNKPYFITGNGSRPGNYNGSVTAASKSSETDLIHVVAVYDPATLTSSIYVNGVLEGTKSIDPVFGEGQGLTFNKFCLGADVNDACLGTEYQATDLTLVDAKIYIGVMSDYDAAAAYEAAVNSLK